MFSCFFETTQRLILCNATQKCHNSKTTSIPPNLGKPYAHTKDELSIVWKVYNILKQLNPMMEPEEVYEKLCRSFRGKLLSKMIPE